MPAQIFTTDQIFGTSPVKAPKANPHHTVFQELAKSFGAAITSLDRTPEKNAKVGGKSNSQHLRGSAGDFVVPKDKKEAFMADARGRGYTPIDEGDHVHLQLPKGQGSTQVKNAPPKKGNIFTTEDIFGEGNVIDEGPGITPTAIAPKPSISGFIKDVVTHPIRNIEDAGGRSVMEAGKAVGNFIKNEFNAPPSTWHDSTTGEELTPEQVQERSVVGNRGETIVRNATKFRTPTEDYQDAPDTSAKTVKEVFTQSPIDRFLDKSIVGNTARAVAHEGDFKAKAIAAARAKRTDEYVLKNPELFHPEQVERSKEALTIWEESHPSMSETIGSMIKMAKEDPGALGVGLLDATMNDPWMVAAPGGVLKHTANTSRLARAADAAGTGGVMAAATVATQQKATGTGEIKGGELVANTLLASGLSGILGGLGKGDLTSKFAGKLKDRMKRNPGADHTADFVEGLRKKKAAEAKAANARDLVVSDTALARARSAEAPGAPVHPADPAAVEAAVLPTPGKFGRSGAEIALAKRSTDRTPEDLAAIRKAKEDAAAFIKGNVTNKQIIAMAGVTTLTALGYNTLNDEKKLAGTVFGGLVGLGILKGLGRGRSVLNHLHNGKIITSAGELTPVVKRAFKSHSQVYKDKLDGIFINRELGDTTITHPATYSTRFNPIFADIAKEFGAETVLDPFGGVGTIGKIKEEGFTGKIIANELESEWSDFHKDNGVDTSITGDARNMKSIKTGEVDMIITSPTYGNALAFPRLKGKLQDLTYANSIGRELTSGNSGRMTWGPKYRKLHEDAYKEFYRVIKNDGIAVINMKNYISDGKPVLVTEFHIKAMEDVGFKLLRHEKVPTPGMGKGKISRPTVGYESIIVFQKQKPLIQGASIVGDSDLATVTKAVLQKDAEGKAPLEERRAGEVALAKKIAAGDEQVFNTLWRNTHKSLTTFARKYLRTAGPRLGVDAEELVQEAFIKIHSTIGEFRGESALDTWMFGVVKNEGLKKIREAQNLKSGGGGRGQEYAVTFEPADAVSVKNTSLGENYDTSRSPIDTAGVANNEDPLAVLENNEHLNQLQKSVNKLPILQREVWMKSAVDAMPIDEIAQSLGIDYNTVKKRLEHAREKVDADMRRYYGAEGPGKLSKNQRGFIDPDLLKTILIGAAGAAIAIPAGIALNRKTPVVSGIIGALGAFGVFKFGKAWPKVKYAGNVMSSRVLKESPELYAVIQKYHHQKDVQTHVAISAVDPFLTEFNRLSAKNKAALDGVLRSHDQTLIPEVINFIDNPKLTEGWEVTRGILDNINTELVRLGRYKNGAPDYFPLRVTNVEGLKKALGTEASSKLKDAIDAANRESIRKHGEALSPNEESIIINDMLKGFQSDGTLSHLPGFAKARANFEITPELRKFYAEVPESLHSYLRDSIKDIAKSRMFEAQGSLKTIKEGSHKYTNVNASIGEIVRTLIKKGELTPEFEVEVTAMLKAMFGPGEKASPAWIAGPQNILGMLWLGKITASVTQVGSTIPISIFLHDLRPTLKAVVKLATGRAVVKAKDFGLADSMSQEFVREGWTAKVRNKTMTAAGFRFGDLLDKSVKLNAALEKLRMRSKTVRGINQIRAEYGKLFSPEEFDQIIKDLKNSTMGKDGRLTNDVDFLIYVELAKSDPINGFEVTEFHASNPKGRSLTFLRSYMTKTVDIAVRQGFEEIAKGNVAWGIWRLTALSTALAVGGLNSASINNILLGRPIDDVDALKILDMITKQFGLGEHIVETAQGTGPYPRNEPAPGSAAVEFFAPPVVTGTADLINRAARDQIGVRDIPIIGNIIYARSAEGKARYEKAQKMKDKRKAKRLQK